jgi:hypothetical protein
MGKLEVPEGIRVPRSMVALRQPRQARNRLSTAHQEEPDTAFGGVEVVGRWMKPASAEFYGCSKLAPADADMDKIVSIKVYLTDLALDAEFSKVRGEVFPHNPPMGGVTSHYGRSGLPRIVGSRHCRVRAARSAARPSRSLNRSSSLLESGRQVGCGYRPSWATSGPIRGPTRQTYERFVDRFEHSGARACFASAGLDAVIAPFAPKTLETLAAIGGGRRYSSVTSSRAPW